MATHERVRVGIVGLGGIAQHHADRLESRDCEIVGGVDVDESTRAAFAEAFGVPTDGSAAELFETAEAVLITTPNRFHEEYAVAALEAGCDVLLEKPVAHTLESAERIAAAAESASGFCMVGFNNRFAPPVEVLRAFQREGRFGELTHVEANYVRRRGIPGRGSWFTSKAVAGGGALIDIGVHAIDLALYFLEYPSIAEVSGTTRSQFGSREDYVEVDPWGEDIGPDGFDVEDSATAFIRTVEDRTVSLDVAWATNRPTNNEFVVRGTDAGARFDRSTHELTIYETDDQGAKHDRDTEITTGETDTYGAELAYFLDHVERGETPTQNTVEEGLTVQRVIDAIYRSAETGRAVSLDD